MDLLFLCSWVVTGLCFGSPWDASKCAFSGAAAAQCLCHNSIPPSMRSCSSSTHGCTDLSFAGWGHSSFQHCAYRTSLVAVPWSFEGNQVCWKTLKGKEDSEAFAEKWATPELNWADWDQWIAQGGRGSPGEAVKYFFWSIHLRMLLQLLQGLNIIELVLLQLL